MTTATNNNFIMTTLENDAPAKKRRLQFATEMETLGPETCPAPTTIALTGINAAVEPHPAPIKSLCVSVFHKFSALKNKEKQQLATNDRLTEDTFLPRSARLAFDMRASAGVSETDEFKTLAASMAEKTLQWKNDAKGAILKVAELESKATRIAIILLLANSALELAKLFLLKENPDDDLTIAPHLVHYGCVTIGDPLFGYIRPANSATTTVSFRDFLTVLPTIFTTSQGPFAPNPLQKVTLNPIIPAFTDLLKSIFVDSWNSQLKAHQAIASERAMARELKQFLDGGATQEAAIVIDEEPSVDPKVLRDLIKTQVQAQQKKMQAEIAKLSQQLARQGTSVPNQRTKTAKKPPGKNSTRGAPATKQRAPSPKKTRDNQNNNRNRSPKRNQQTKQNSRGKQTNNRNGNDALAGNNANNSRSTPANANNRNRKQQNGNNRGGKNRK